MNIEISPSIQEEIKDHEITEMLAILERSLQIFSKASQSESFRKILSAGDKKGNVCIFFQGDEEDAYAVEKFLNERPKE